MDRASIRCLWVVLLVSMAIVGLKGEPDLNNGTAQTQGKAPSLAIAQLPRGNAVKSNESTSYNEVEVNNRDVYYRGGHGGGSSSGGGGGGGSGGVGGDGEEEEEGVDGGNGDVGDSQKGEKEEEEDITITLTATTYTGIDSARMTIN
ncbi:hypothetical protein L484_019423 [Morus notabilis]|uniref:Uncharacterized protein n=1 Tax=Morus notabilis TaxID=981085 RepID=W9RZ17_9ROSA|nr:hypothetical protein L484_019423 [Morus notabilis]